MEKKRTSYEQAIRIYKERYGKEPTEIEIQNLWHSYVNEWKHFDGFEDWLIYQGK